MVGLTFIFAVGIYFGMLLGIGLTWLLLELFTDDTSMVINNTYVSESLDEIEAGISERIVKGLNLDEFNKMMK